MEVMEANKEVNKEVAVEDLVAAKVEEEAEEDLVKRRRMMVKIQEKEVEKKNGFQ